MSDLPPAGIRQSNDMIERIVEEIADEMAVPRTVIQLVDGFGVGVRGVYLLKMTVNETTVATLIHEVQSADGTESVEEKLLRNRIRHEMCRILIFLHCKHPGAFAEP